MNKRLPNSPGIDSSFPIRFSFNGKSYYGFKGDTLASALLANKVRLVGRSFKYHRPRGVFSDGSDEPNALVTVVREGHPEPNTRATEVELYDGLDARSQNAWPSLRFDLLSVNGRFSRFLTAGFYYKTFMWPSKFWEALYEPAIRRAAGLGQLSDIADPSQYDKAYLHPHFLVIGGGVAGLIFASKVARSDRSVVLADERANLGGRLLFSADSAQRAWLDGLIAEVKSNPNIKCMVRTTIFGSYDHGVYGAVTRNTEHFSSIAGVLPKQTFWKISTQKTVLATGALNRNIVFPNNDRPGIMTLSALETYANYYGALPDASIALFISQNEGRRIALKLHYLGLRIQAVIDIRSGIEPLVEFPYYVGARVINTSGSQGLRRIKVGLSNGKHCWVQADYLGVSGGYNPTIQLSCHQGAKPIWDESIQAFRASGSRPADQLVIGAANGVYDLGDCWANVMKAAQDFVDEPLALDNPFPISEPTSYQLPLVIEDGSPAFVDLQNDVTVKDIQLSHQEGMSSVEHMKRYTTLGMATDQGKHSNLLGLMVLAKASNCSIKETGTTLSRPPYTGVSIGALAGRHRGLDFKPVRKTPSHQEAERRDAIFVEAANWLRAQWYPRPYDINWWETVNREVISVRRYVGICDVTTLGKIDVQGSDAGAFLNRVYANEFSNLPVGKTRYGLMLREDGIVMDDGTAARLVETHFVVTTTTSNATTVYRHMEFVRQCLCPQMDVHLISTTEAWAQFAVAGPLSRELISRIVDCDVSNDAFPFMACAQIRLKSGMRARLFRISFSGELAYEIAVPARVGNSFFKKLLEIGEDLNVTPYGTEALGVLRIEKGHPAGPEINGRTTARQLGLEHMLIKTKDSIGRLLSEREHLAKDSTRLVGLKSVNPKDEFLGGAHLVALGDSVDAGNDLGFVTSVAYSPHCRSIIGLAYLKDATLYQGKIIRAVSLVDDLDVEVEVVSPHFVDPEGERLRA